MVGSSGGKLDVIVKVARERGGAVAADTHSDTLEGALECSRANFEIRAKWQMRILSHSAPIQWQRLSDGIFSGLRPNTVELVARCAFIKIYGITWVCG